MSIIGRATHGLYPQDEGSQGAVCMINIVDIALDTVWRAIKVVEAKGIKPLAKVSATGIKSMASNLSSTNKDLANLAKNGDKLDSFTVNKKDLSTFRNAFKKYGIEFVEVKTNDGVEIFFKTKDYDRIKHAIQSILKDLNSRKETMSKDENIIETEKINEAVENVSIKEKNNPDKIKSAAYSAANDSSNQKDDNLEEENKSKERNREAINDIDKSIDRVMEIKNQVDLQSLISQEKELNSIDIGETELAPLQKLCKKYGVEIAVVEAADGSYNVFFKAQDYTRLEAALKDIGIELDRELGKTPKDIQIVNAEQNINDITLSKRPRPKKPINRPGIDRQRVTMEEQISKDSHIQRLGEERKKLPMKEQIDKAKVKADKINKEQQKQREKSQNRNRNKPGRAKGGAR